METRILRTYTRHLPLLLVLAMSGCGDPQTASTPASPAPAQAAAPQVLYLSPGALQCPSLDAAMQTLDYLRRGVGQGELRGSCSLSEGAQAVAVEVTQTELQRVTRLAPNLEKILYWRGRDGATGFTPLLFLQRKQQSIYPLSITGASTRNRVPAYLDESDLRRLVAVDPMSQEAGNIQVEIKRKDRIEFVAVDRHPLEILTLRAMPTAQNVAILAAQWRLAGGRDKYWSRLTELVDKGGARAALADTLGSRF